MSLEPELSLEQTKEKVKKLKHPRVSEDSIRAKVKDVDFLRYDGITTFCIITMNNGFRFYGTSTPASPENFDAAIGQRYAYENAFRQIWTHEGYLLRDKLAGTEQGE